MRIGIITFQRVGNYGAELQAYALQTRLNQMGYTAENIDYLYYRHPRFQVTPRAKAVHALSPVTRLKATLFPVFSKLRALRHRALSRERVRLFESFDAHLRCSREYRTIDELYAAPGDYDVYLVGSDQVWNPRTNTNLGPYFLDFVPAGKRCVSYAASIGAPTLSPVNFMYFKTMLQRFEAVGLREETAVRLVSGMNLGVEVRRNLDPTLLLQPEDWRALACKPKAFDESVPYLLLYDLIASSETITLAEEEARREGLRLVRLGDGAYGPAEFLWLVDHATRCVSNSFHGTVFSILLRRPFTTVIPRGMTNASRIEDLLALLGLLGRMVRAQTIAQSQALSLPEIDWDAVEMRLKAAQCDAEAFLRRALETPALRKTPRLPLACYALWNKDPAARAAATSGGLFGVLAEATLVRGGTVYGSAFDEDFHSVHHRAARSREALVPLFKSKYCWSDPKTAYREALADLRAGREVLFSGTPCQCAAMRAQAQDCDERLFTVDIVCHGTPEPRYFAAYIRELEAKFRDRVVAYDFRDKRRGWNFPRVCVTFSRSGERILRYDPYFAAFSLNLTLRPGCLRCPYAGLERAGDFTLADCWRVAASHPQYDDGRGTSLLLVNTSKARERWQAIEATGCVAGGSYNIALAQQRNVPLMMSAYADPLLRARFRQRFEETGSFAQAARCFLTTKARVRAMLKCTVKFLLWPILKGRQ